MATITLSERCKKVIKRLYLNTSYTPVQNIADELEVTKRSVYYDLCTINEWFADNGIPEIDIVRGKGVQLTSEQKDKLQSLTNKNTSVDQNHVYLPSDRLKIIICVIIYHNGPILIKQLMEYCDVSRNTIFGDLRLVVDQLKEYNLELKYDSRYGYSIKGDIFKIRALFLLYFKDLKTFIMSGILPLSNRDEIMEHFNSLLSIEKKLGVTYVEGNLFSLAVLITLILKSQKPDQLHFSGFNIDDIKKSKEYHVISEFFPSMVEKERVYLSIHLLGSQLLFATDEMFEPDANQSIYELTKALVSEFQKVACVTFENRSDLERALFIHISSSMYRYQFGILIGDSISKDVQKEYPQLFHITKVVSKYIEKLIGTPISDSEVAYLALHFGANLTITRSIEKLRVLIVCVNGVSTGNMLKKEVMRLLPDVSIVGVVSATHVLDAQDICDLVITTINIPSSVPSIIVNPILSKEDRTNILNHEVIHRSTPTHSLSPNVNDETIRLYLYLNLINVKICHDSLSWEDSLYYASQSLVDQKSINVSYIEAMVRLTNMHGPYMFINDDVILAHAHPDDGVNRLSLTLTVFKKPIEFPKGRSAQIMFVLAAEDQEKHLPILDDLLTIASNNEVLRQMVEYETPEELIRFLYNHLN